MGSVLLIQTFSKVNKLKALNLRNLYNHLSQGCLMNVFLCIVKT